MKRIAHTLALVLLAAANAGAQSISGIVRLKATQQPFVGVDVELWSDDSTVNVNRTVRSDSSGTFAFLNLPAAHYHLEFYAAQELLGAAGPYLVASDSDVQRAYLLDAPEKTFLAYQVERPVQRLRSNPRVPFPPELVAQGVHGQVTMQFVVDQTGRVVATSIKTIHSDDLRLVEPVKTALLEMRFEPAEVGGQKVKQLVQQSFNFTIGGGLSMATPP